MVDIQQYKTFPKIGRLGLKSGEQEKNSQIGSLPPKSGELEPLKLWSHQILDFYLRG